MAGWERSFTEGAEPAWPTRSARRGERSPHRAPKQTTTLVSVAKIPGAPRKAGLSQVGGLLRKVIGGGSTQVPPVPHPGAPVGWGSHGDPAEGRTRVMLRTDGANVRQQAWVGQP